jgi:hypothetical protein
MRRLCRRHVLGPEVDEQKKVALAAAAARECYQRVTAGAGTRAGAADCPAVQLPHVAIEMRCCFRRVFDLIGMRYQEREAGQLRLQLMQKQVSSFRSRCVLLIHVSRCCITAFKRRGGESAEIGCDDGS